MPKIKVQKITQNAMLPQKTTPHSSCFDLFSQESLKLFPGRTHSFKTGLKIELPIGYEATIRPRSHMLQKGIITLGTVDPDYRGEIKVILLNTSNQTYKIFQYDRIAQMNISKVLPTEFIEVEELTETERGEKGFGSSGR